MQFIQQGLLWQPTVAASDNSGLGFMLHKTLLVGDFFEARFSFSPAFEGHI